MSPPTGEGAYRHKYFMNNNPNPRAEKSCKLLFESSSIFDELDPLTEGAPPKSVSTPVIVDDSFWDDIENESDASSHAKDNSEQNDKAKG